MRRKRYDSVPINGVTKSLKAWCQQTRVDPNLAYRRIHYLEWPPAQAVGLEPRVVRQYGKKSKISNHKNTTLTHKGVTRTLREWHEITLIPYTTLVHRFNQVPDWTSDAILDTEPNTPTARRQKKMHQRAAVWTPDLVDAEEGA
jgi:hypothetical protein